MQLLIVEDDEVTRRFVQAQLESHGIAVTAASDVAAGQAAVRTASFDIVMLDLNLPDGSGLDVLECVRESGSTAHVIILSGASTEGDRVRALQLGADDYVVKPFFARELTARVLAVRRRLDASQEKVLRFGKLAIDLRSRQVTADDSTVQLTPREFDLLAFLASHPGRVFSRDELLREVWQSASEWQQTATVTEHMSTLRSKIEVNQRQPRLLVTVRGAGYRLDPPVVPSEADED